MALIMLVGSIMCVVALSLVRRVIPEERPVARFTAAFLRLVFVGYVAIWATIIIGGIT